MIKKSKRKTSSNTTVAEEVKAEIYIYKNHSANNKVLTPVLNKAQAKYPIDNDNKKQKQKHSAKERFSF